MDKMRQLEKKGGYIRSVMLPSSPAQISPLASTSSAAASRQLSAMRASAAASSRASCRPCGVARYWRSVRK